MRQMHGGRSTRRSKRARARRPRAQERNANPRTQFNVLMACVHVIRFLFHDESKVGGGRRGGRLALLPGLHCQHSTMQGAPCPNLLRPLPNRLCPAAGPQQPAGGPVQVCGRARWRRAAHRLRRRAASPVCAAAHSQADKTMPRALTLRHLSTWPPPQRPARDEGAQVADGQGAARREEGDLARAQQGSPVLPFCRGQCTPHPPAWPPTLCDPANRRRRWSRTSASSGWSGTSSWRSSGSSRTTAQASLLAGRPPAAHAVPARFPRWLAVVAGARAHAASRQGG